MKKCAFVLGEGGRVDKFTRANQDSLIKNVIEPMARDGLRTISLAYWDFVPGKADINQFHFDASTGPPDWDDEQKIVSNLTAVCLVSVVLHLMQINLLKKQNRKMRCSSITCYCSQF